MITITKIFRFETAHAIYGYQGPCAHIHGHSYELHVRVAAEENEAEYIGGTGIIIDFKDLKALVQTAVIKKLDHKLVLSREYLAATTNSFAEQEVVIFDAEPTAENLLIYIRKEIQNLFPENIRLRSLTLWETRDSYAEWFAQ
jgi:6-pyruvoyltetrahydropterin/6-carboxytetrahydropterin synthase